MLANYEHRSFNNGVNVWIEMYMGLKNIAHWHMEEELVVCTCGRAVITVDGEYYPMHAGECAFIGCGSLHKIESNQDCILIVSQFENGCKKSGVSHCLKTPVFRDRYHAREKMEKVLCEYKEKPRLFAEMIEAIIMQLKIEILRKEEVVLREFAVPAYLGRYLNLLKEIDDHYASITFSEAASFMNMSEAYFSRFFKKATGMTFSHYLERLRINRAVDLINKNRKIPVRDILVDTGFNTIRSFNRAFKTTTGYSPKQLPNGFDMTERGYLSWGESFDPTIEGRVV